MPRKVTRFAELLLLSGWNARQFASQINCTTQQVEAWQRGERPPSGSLGFALASTLGQRLGREVGLKELRRRPSRSYRGDHYSNHDHRIAARVLCALTAADLMANRRGCHSGDDIPPLTFIPEFGSLVPEPGIEEIEGGDTLDELEIMQLERAVEIFRAWNEECGGHLHRKAIVGQLNEVAGLIAASPPCDTESRLWKVAADLAELICKRTAEEGLRPLAQRYSDFSELTQRIGISVLSHETARIRTLDNLAPAHSMRRPLRIEGGVLRLAAWLLPEETRETWLAEWAAELHATTSAKARLGYALSILVHAPVLARIESGRD